MDGFTNVVQWHDIGDGCEAALEHRLAGYGFTHVNLSFSLLITARKCGVVMFSVTYVCVSVRALTFESFDL